MAGATIRSKSRDQGIGGRDRDRPLSEAGGKGLFTKELDTSLMMGGIDLAVHSAKDLPTWLPDAIVIAG